MYTATIKYKGQLRTNAIHLQSGNEIITDAPTDNHGKGEAFSPTDLLSTSLACCMLTIMGITARKNDIIFEDASADITKVMTVAPRRVDEIIVKIKMPKVAYSDKEKKLLEVAALNCPVAKSLSSDLTQSVTFEY